MAIPDQLSSIRGFNYTPSSARNDIEFWRDYDEALVERELTFAQRLGLNSARPFLAYVVYEREPAAFLRRLRHFVRAAYDRGIGTMPVVWDSCFSEVQPAYDIDSADWVPNPGTERLGPDFWPEGERYCQDLVDALGPEPGLAMWDVMNEPMVTSYVQGPNLDALRPGADEGWVREHESIRDQRIEEIWDFVRHFCGVMRRMDPDHPITVGVHRASNLAVVGAHVDILSFHDYRPTRSAVRAHIAEAQGYADRLGKPVFVSEIGCLARANPYDMTLEIFHQAGLGWYLWELMIGVSRWRDIHGIVYPDGTVRDPSIVAAVQGFFRKRSADAIAPNVDKEGAATRALTQTEEWLCNAEPAYAEGVAILEAMANLLEAGEHVSMDVPPSTEVLALRQEDGGENRARLVRLLVNWSELLRAHAAPA